MKQVDRERQELTRSRTVIGFVVGGIIGLTIGTLVGALLTFGPLNSFAVSMFAIVICIPVFALLGGGIARMIDRSSRINF